MLWGTQRCGQLEQWRGRWWRCNTDLRTQNGQYVGGYLDLTIRPFCPQSKQTFMFGGLLLLLLLLLLLATVIITLRFSGKTSHLLWAYGEDKHLLTKVRYRRPEFQRSTAAESARSSGGIFYLWLDGETLWRRIVLDHKETVAGARRVPEVSL